MISISFLSKDGKEIARTGKIDFTLSQPHYGGNGKHTVII